MLEFSWPWLALLLPLPLVVRWLSRSGSNAGAALRAPFYQDWQELIGQQETRNNRGGNAFILLLMSLLWLCLVAAACRPNWVGDPINLPTSGRDLMLAVDISGSMAQEDMVINDRALPRITVVKAVVNEFVRQRQGDKLGLILFGSQAYIQSPLSFDLQTLQVLMDEAQVGFAGKQTAIGDAIGFAIKRLRERQQSSRVLILLTDGADTASTLPPMRAADLAAKAGIRIYTIGVGATEMEIGGLFGSRFGARTVNPSADLDENTLRGIAEATGGQYYRARNPAELQKAYSDIATLEPIEQDSQPLRPRRSLLHWPLLAALVCATLIAFVSAWGERHIGRQNREVDE
ncbi:VWA domain-containing protein [Spongiibacter nanhainus]|uniref:VWA domain-containing protein n=1 Tax=Spongiibacter nanhainus TaxID=2794344 RepID=A0A7T4QZ75_9GAMM|nr:VWA domain-containing protein [Spongiibacter nanhainus]QQD17389.1 VWA domain-containing protein [Spongiibacter nanhainus]